MNIYTLAGRLQTKLLTFMIAAASTALFTTIGGHNYWLLFAVAIIAGLLLELVWGWVVTYQPGYLTWLFGLVEFGVITAAAVLLGFPFTIGQAAVYFWTTWAAIQLFLIYLLPALNLSWGDNGGELW